MSFDKNDNTFQAFHHVEFYVTNAKQVAQHYVARFGFEPVAYRGLETGSRDVASTALRHGKIVFVFSSPLNPDPENPLAKRIAVTGDAVKDVAFEVTDAKRVYERAVEKGAESVEAPREVKDENGSAIIASVKTYGDTVHSFVQKIDYKGPFLPGYVAWTKSDPYLNLLARPALDFIDHIVGNQPDLKMEEACSWYERCLDFHRFWSIDDKMMHTKYSALRSVVMASPGAESIKMPINEPAAGLRKSQIQEYVDYHGGAGVQHIALNTQNIIESVRALRARGVEFLEVPKSYYDDLRQRLAKAPINVAEDLDVIEELKILVDFDDRGYLLQLFTKPVEDRPTLFYEVIQRRGHDGFGAGNFKSLFEAIEREQAERGNL